MKTFDDDSDEDGGLWVIMAKHDAVVLHAAGINVHGFSKKFAALKDRVHEGVRDENVCEPAEN